MWLVDFLIETVGIAITDLIADRIPAWGCVLIIGAIAVAALLVWLT